MSADIPLSEHLRSLAEPDWSAAVGHRFTRELADDTLPDDAFAAYLIQDYAFLETLVGLVGHAVGHAPTMDQKKRYAGFLGVLTGDEDDFFIRSFEAIGVPDADWRTPDVVPVMQAFAELFGEAASHGYPETLAALLPVEWVYLSWAMREKDAMPARFYLREWITLHTDPGFQDFVTWMASEMDRLGPTLDDAARSRVETLFRRAIELEVRFFDLAYA